MKLGKTLGIILLGIIVQHSIMAQEVTANDLTGIWEFKSWKTYYSNFHPDMEPEEGSEDWKEIEIDQGTVNFR